MPGTKETRGINPKLVHKIIIKMEKWKEVQDIEFR